MTAPDLATIVAAGVAAIEAGDFPTALSKMRSARLLISTTPNLTVRARSMNWNAAALDKAIEDIKQQMSANVGIQRQVIRWGGPLT